jgi:hypothetical protein
VGDGSSVWQLVLFVIQNVPCTWYMLKMRPTYESKETYRCVSFDILVSTIRPGTQRAEKSGGGEGGRSWRAEGGTGERKGGCVREVSHVSL